MNKRITYCLFLAILIMVPGCLTTAEMKIGHFEDLIGQDKAALTSRFGPPFRTTSKGDKTYLSYKLMIENPGDLDVYTFEINKDDIVEDITLKRLMMFGIEVDHWPHGNGIP